MQLTSCLSEIADPLLLELSSYLTRKVGQPINFYMGDWAAREAALYNDEAQLGWICGLLHVWKEREMDWPFVPVAAPVMTAVRYQQQPVYFSDVVVHEDSPIQSLEELAGSRWAYNETTSFSGYHIMLNWLASQEKTADFFSQQICSGAHSHSLQLVASGAADCAAIDSTVLDMLTANDPAWQMPLRVVGSLGPYPMPPLVVSVALDRNFHAAVQQAVCQAHEETLMADIFAAWGMSHWTAVSNQTYDPIRQLPLNL